MSNLVGGGWEALGYREAPAVGGKTASEVAAFIGGVGGVYDVQGGSWVRQRGRGTTDALPNVVSLVGIFDRTEVGALANLRHVVDYHRTDWARPHPAVQTDEVAGLASDLTTNTNLAQGFVNLGKAVGLCSPERLPETLEKHVLPQFFANYPDGKVAVVWTNPASEGAAAALRGLYTLANIALADLDPNEGFPTLREWQAISAHNTVRLLLESFGSLFYPYQIAYRCGRLGLDLLFIPDESLVYEPPVFPADWLALMGSRATFGEQDVDAFGGQAEEAKHRRYRHQGPWKAEAVARLLDWYVERLNNLVYELQDPCNFANEHNTIDPQMAFEHYLSVMRLFKRIAAVQSVREGALAKTFTFEVADLLDTIAHLFGNKGATVFFKELFNPVAGPNSLMPLLGRIPAPFDAHTSAVTQEIYLDLRTTILDSVWVPGKRQAGGVLVRNRHLTAENLEAEEDFVANVIRALRNGHHGHFTAGDPANRPARYLFMVNGDTPDSMSALPAIWLLAYLADPAFAGWAPLGIRCHQALPGSGGA